MSKDKEILIRQATIRDLSALTAIYNDIIKEGKITADLDTYSVEQREQWFYQHTDHPYTLFVLEENDKVLGYFYFSPWRAGRAALKAVAEISFFLDKQARGRGLGDLVMKASLLEAKERGFKHLIAILMNVNERSEHLLDKWGYKLVGELPDVIELPDRTAGQLIMMKTL